jgi:hypothetical protein
VFLQEHSVMTETSTHFCHDTQVHENTMEIATKAAMRGASISLSFPSAG